MAAFSHDLHYNKRFLHSVQLADHVIWELYCLIKLDCKLATIRDRLDDWPNAYLIGDDLDFEIFNSTNNGVIFQVDSNLKVMNAYC